MAAARSSSSAFPDHHPEAFGQAPLPRVLLHASGKPRIHFDRQHPDPGGQQRKGQRALPGPDLHDRPRLSGADRRGHEALGHRPVVEKVLPPRPRRKERHASIVAMEREEGG